MVFTALAAVHANLIAVMLLNDRVGTMPHHAAIEYPAATGTEQCFRFVRFPTAHGRSPPQGRYLDAG